MGAAAVMIVGGMYLLVRLSLWMLANWKLVGLSFIALYLASWWFTNPDIYYDDARVMVEETRLETKDRFGSPDSCRNQMYELICRYRNANVHTYQDRITLIEYTRLNGIEFSNDKAFYEKMLATFRLPYKEPSVSTMDVIIWEFDGFGIVEIWSSDRMKVSSIKIHPERTLPDV